MRLLLIQVAWLAATALSAPTAPVPAPTPADSPTVHLDYASYRGTHLVGAGVDQFLGMRFAAPSLGDLRFRAPQEPAHEDQIQDASKFRPRCLGAHDTPSDFLAEDCLFVNVFKPTNATASVSKLPVWVFIQGGGYSNDANGDFNGTEVIRQTRSDIVFVNFNYRVGVLGFLASEAVRKDGALNAGLLDQRQLLHWVQKYIGEFGGDPDHVVIHGDSAGAGSVAYHLTAYGGRDDHENNNKSLFVGAMLESPFWPTQRTVAAMEFQYSRLLHDTGCDSLGCLRGVEMGALNRASSLPIAFPEAASGDPTPLWYWLPVVDGDLVQDHMYAQFGSGRFRRVPTLVGDDTDEGTIFAANAASETEARAFLRANFPRLQSWQLDLISTLYPRQQQHPHQPQPPSPEEQHAAYFDSAAAAYGDSTFVCAGNTMADAVSQYAGGDKAWNYRYNVEDPASLARGVGVPHVAELGAVLGPDDVQGQTSPSLRTTDAAMVPVTMAYFSSFVQFLNPNAARYPGSPEWENWSSVAGGGQRLRLQTNKTAMEQVPFDLEEKCMMWRLLSKTMDL